MFSYLQVKSLFFSLQRIKYNPNDSNQDIQSEEISDYFVELAWGYRLKVNVIRYCEVVILAVFATWNVTRTPVQVTILKMLKRIWKWFLESYRSWKGQERVGRLRIKK